MAYDQELATRIRGLMEGTPGLSEKAMFGGLAFLIGGNMAIAASGQGGILVHIKSDETDQILESSPEAEPMVMRGRPMRGWIRVPIESLQSDEALEKWVNLGRDFAARLPAKQ